MKIVYRNGQKFVISDALYKTYQNMSLFEDLEKDALFSDEEINSYKKISDMDEHEINEFFQNRLTDLEDLIPELILKSNIYEDFSINFISKSKNKEEEINEWIVNFTYYIIQGIESRKDQIIGFIKKAESKNNIPNIFKYFQQLAGNVIRDVFISDRTLIKELIKGNDNINTNSLYEEYLLNFLTIIADGLGNSASAKPTQNNKKMDDFVLEFLNDNKENVNIKDGSLLKEKFMKIINRFRVNFLPIVVSGVNITNDQMFFNAYDKSEPKNKEATILVKSLKTLVKRNQTLFTENVKYLMITKNGVQMSPVDVDIDYKKETVVPDLPSLLSNDMYPINKLIREIIAEWRTKTNDTNYSRFIQKTKSKNREDKIDTDLVSLVSEIDKLINKTSIANENWLQDIVYCCKDRNGLGISNRHPLLSYENNNLKNIEIIKSVLSKTNNTQKNRKKDKITNIKLLFNAKQVLEEIEKNDYYKMTELLEKAKSDSFKNFKPIMFEIFSIMPKDLFDNSEVGIYLEYVYVTLLTKLINNEAVKEFSTLTKEEKRKLRTDMKDKMGKPSDEIRQLSQTWHGKKKVPSSVGKLFMKELEKFPSDDNLLKFIRSVKRKPSEKEDKQQYMDYFYKLNQYSKWMDDAEQYFLNGISELGLFEKEMDIRPIQDNAIQHLLKNKDIIDENMDRICAYAYLTECYNYWKPIFDVSETYLGKSNTKKNSAIMNQFSPFMRMFTEIEKIIPKDKDEQITYNFITRKLFREILIYTNVDLRDVSAAFSENELFDNQIKIGAIKYGEEGEGNTVFTIPILKNKKCIGAFRMRKIFSRTSNTLKKMWNHDLTNSIKNLWK